LKSRSFVGYRVSPGCILLACCLLHAPLAAHGESLDRFLLQAARLGDAATVEHALMLGANIDYVEHHVPDAGGDTPLYVAVKARSRETVQVLLVHGANMLQRPPGGPPGSGPWSEAPLWKFPLYLSKETDREIFNLLLSSVKQLPPADDRIVDYAVRPAAKMGDVDVLGRLETLGVRLSAISPSGNTLVTGAVAAGRFKEAAIWMEKYRESYRKEANREIRIDEAVEYAVAHPADDDRLAAFIADAGRSGLSIIPKNRWGDPMWKRAAGYRLPATARALGCPPDEQAKIVPRSSEELLLAAACRPESHSLFVELAAKALLEARDPKAEATRLFGTLTHSVLLHPTGEALDVLISRGADVNIESQTGKGLPQTPLQAVILRSDLDLATALLARGADINHVNGDTGLTALEVAAWTGKLKVLRWVLERGALLLERQTGRPLLRAVLGPGERSGDYDDIIAEFLTKGADPYLKSGEDQKSAVDVLAERHDILRLRRLDTGEVYRSLVGEYNPPPDSPFVGVWSNGKDGFAVFGIIMTPDGQALLSFSSGPAGFFPWRTVGPAKAVIEATIDKRRMDVELVWLSSEESIRLSTPGELNGILVRKRPEKVLTAEEYTRQRKEKEKEAQNAKPVAPYYWEGTPDYAPGTKDLAVQGKGLTVLDPRVDAMASLETLALTDNRLRTLPESLRRMKRLVSVGVGQNWFAALPPWFAELTSLKNLSLDSNAFRKLPAEIRPLKNLRQLDLSYNQLKALPEWWGEFPALERIYLNGNQLSGLPGSCAGLMSLEEIRLAENSITGVPECLARLPKLRNVYLNGNPIPVEEQQRLKSAYPKVRWVF